MSNELLTIQIYPTGIRVTNCDLVTLDCKGCCWGFPRQRVSRVRAKCRWWGLWTKAKAQGSKITFPGQWDNQGKIQDSDQCRVYSKTFRILKGQSWKAIIPTGQQLVGIQHPTRWLFTFYVWSGRNLLSLCGRNKQGLFSVFISFQPWCCQEGMKRALTSLVSKFYPLCHC